MLQDDTLLIEEYNTTIIYITYVYNAVANTINRLDYKPKLNRHADDEVIAKKQSG